MVGGVGPYSQEGYPRLFGRGVGPYSQGGKPRFGRGVGPDVLRGYAELELIAPTKNVILAPQLSQLHLRGYLMDPPNC